MLCFCFVCYTGSWRVNILGSKSCFLVMLYYFKSRIKRIKGILFLYAPYGKHKLTYLWNNITCQFSRATMLTQYSYPTPPAPPPLNFTPEKKWNYIQIPSHHRFRSKIIAEKKKNHIEICI
jgi:hypothetical protein